MSVLTAPLPTPRMREVLTDTRLSSTSKVVYSFLDDLGQGSPVAIPQHQLAEALGLVRETVAARIADLRKRGYIGVSVWIDPNGRRINTYQTRVVAGAWALEPVIYGE